MKMTFEDGMQESMLPMFGWVVGNDGIAREPGGSPAPTFSGEPVGVDNIAGFVNHPDTGETVILEDNFPTVCDYVRAKDEETSLTEFISE